MKKDLIVILVDSFGNIIEAITDGVDDGIVIITESVEIFGNIIEGLGSALRFFK